VNISEPLHSKDNQMPDDILPNTVASNSTSNDVKFLEDDLNDNTGNRDDNRRDRNSGPLDTGRDRKTEAGDKSDSSDTAESDEFDESESDTDKLEDPEIDPEQISQPNLFKELKTLDPDIFKKVPGLRAVIANEQQYASIFPNVKDAQDAVETIAGFNQLRESVLSGDPKPLLEELVGADPKAAQKFVDNFLPTLLKEAPQAYIKIATPVVNQTLRNLKAMAKQAGNEQLFFAVGHISKALHGDPRAIDQEDAPPRNDEIEAEKKRLEQQQKDFQTNQQKSFHTSTVNDLETRVKNHIRRQLDPDGVIGDRMKNAMIADITSELDKILAQDRRHMANINSLWRESHAKGYTREASDKIISAYLARVKPLLPSHIQKVREDYLSADKRKREELKGNNVKKFIPPSGRPSNNREKSGPIDPKTVNYNHTTDMDILEDKVTYKK